MENDSWPDDLGDAKPRRKRVSKQKRPAKPPTQEEANDAYFPMRPNLTLAKRFKAIGLERPDVLDIARMCAYTNAKMEAVIKAYDAHTNPDFLHWENFCEIAEMPVLEFYGNVMALHSELNTQDAINLAKGALPRIVQRVIENAESPDGYQDRLLGLKIGNMPGVQSGPGINITNTINASQNNFTALGVPKFHSDADDDSTREILEKTLPAQLPAAREEYIDAIEIPREKELEERK